MDIDRTLIEVKARHDIGDHGDVVQLVILALHLVDVVGAGLEDVFDGSVDLAAVGVGDGQTDDVLNEVFSLCEFDVRAVDVEDLTAQKVGFFDRADSLDRDEDLASRKPGKQNWYDIPVGANDFHLSFTLSWGRYLSLIIYTYGPDTYARFESKKTELEKAFATMSEGMKRGMDMVENSESVIKKSTEIFK